MDTKKATTLTIVAIVIAIAAMSVIIAWLGANLPSTGSQEHGNILTHDVSTPTPDELYYFPDTEVVPDYVADNYQDSTPGGDEEYPALPYNYYEYPYDHDAGEENIFTPIFTSEPLPEHIIQLITGVTFHETTPFGYDYLTYLTVTHVNFYGESVLGHLIVAASIGYEVLDIFREIYEGGFPIHSIKLIDYFEASDYLSMAANNSHAFNFRYIAGTTTISRHGFGVAIDINPVQNPYIRGDTIWPAAGVEYLDRTYVRPGMIVPGDVVYNAFMSRGWTWGGYWTWPRDYHHFERRR
ncbi:MAG: M15 family metallopeptidase [Defluviitaleaceae bacterium]|nr:M15 family metallopeptidase [Defluviitaleaceae bacterium]